MTTVSSTISRRDFLKISGTTAVGATAAGLVAFGAAPKAYAASVPQKEPKRGQEFPSVCPYCAVGCGQLAMVSEGQIINIEGNPDSPINQGTLCSKGSASFQLVHNERRMTKGMYRAPGSAEWQEMSVEEILDRVAQRMIESREKNFVETDNGVTVNRTESLAWLGSACVDNEECYLIAKLARTLGIVYLDHQARI
ncbi:MAG: twin-arginine translocation signal domain-containing protein [Anaerolineae bacterium]|nr:twin-arginine translocation signal domain-containing protein [Anaerolineae bacterium]